MKKRFFTLILGVLIVAGAFAQRPYGVINKVTEAPIIDGVIDDVWAESEVYNVDQPFQTDLPTLGAVGETTWRAIWYEEAMYVLIVVTDDDFLSHDVAGVDHYQGDKPEIYWDVNAFDLEDGQGPSAGNSTGHYQVAPYLTMDNIDGTAIDAGIEESDDAGVIYAYLVEDPNYVAEYYIPFSYLVDADGVQVDISQEIGFDVTVIDRDADDEGDHRDRAVWANIGGLGESWSNMNDCGRITFEGAEEGILINSISLTGGDITENNQPLQIVAEIEPAYASNKVLTWTVEEGTGKATINSSGLLTPIMDGTVTVSAEAKDGSYEWDEIEVTISNQLISINEINVIRNGNFDLVNADGTATHWGGWGGDLGAAMPLVLDVLDYTGVAVCTPLRNSGNDQQWQYQFNQNQLTALPDVAYTFSFVAWADATRTFTVDFEDTGGNGYNRYGASTSPLVNPDDPGVAGRSEWKFDVITEPTRYTMDVIFDEIVETTDQKVQYMLGFSDTIVYIDSVSLVADADLALISESVATPVTGIEVSSAGDVTTVTLDATLQMSAVVTPGDATMGGVWWSVMDGTGKATIDASTGLLTPVEKGSVTVVASAKDESGVRTTMEIDVLWATGISQPTTTDIKVYPNPVGSTLHIVLSSVNETVTVYNSVGAKMKEVIVTGTETSVDVSELASGFYFVKAGDAVVKFIK